MRCGWILGILGWKSSLADWMWGVVVLGRWGEKGGVGRPPSKFKDGVSANQRGDWGRSSFGGKMGFGAGLRLRCCRWVARAPETVGGQRTEPGRLPVTTAPLPFQKTVWGTSGHV